MDRPICRVDDACWLVCTAKFPNVPPGVYTARLVLKVEMRSLGRGKIPEKCSRITSKSYQLILMRFLILNVNFQKSNYNYFYNSYIYFFNKSQVSRKCRNIHQPDQFTRWTVNKASNHPRYRQYMAFY